MTCRSKIPFFDITSDQRLFPYTWSIKIIFVHDSLTWIAILNNSIEEKLRNCSLLTDAVVKYGCNNNRNNNNTNTTTKNNNNNYYLYYYYIKSQNSCLFCVPTLSRLYGSSVHESPRLTRYFFYIKLYWNMKQENTMKTVCCEMFSILRLKQRSVSQLRESKLRIQQILIRGREEEYMLTNNDNLTGIHYKLI